MKCLKTQPCAEPLLGHGVMGGWEFKRLPLRKRTLLGGAQGRTPGRTPDNKGDTRGTPSASLLHHTETGSRADVYFYVFPPTFSHVTLSVSQVTHRCLCLSDHITAGRLGEYAGEVW